MALSEIIIVKNILKTLFSFRIWTCFSKCKQSKNLRTRLIGSLHKSKHCWFLKIQNYPWTTSTKKVTERPWNMSLLIRFLILLYYLIFVEFQEANWRKTPLKEEAQNTLLAPTITRWFFVKLNVCFCCSSKLLVTSLKKRIDTPLGPYKHKMTASNFVKILTAPKQKYFDQIFRFS